MPVIGISLLMLEGVDYSEILISCWVAYIKTQREREREREKWQSSERHYI
jgi:hypothetical protein